MKKPFTLQLLTIVLILSGSFIHAQSTHEPNKKNVCLVTNYQAPDPFDGINSIFSEDFASGIVPPTGWTVMGDGQTNWISATSANAGGVAPELEFYWNPQFDGVSRMVTPAISTSGYSALLLSLKHFLDDYGGANSYTLYVETTSDGGSTWNEVWSLADPGANVGPETISILIDNADVGSDNFQLAFTFDGDSYELDGWFIDDVLLEEALSLDAAAVDINVPSIITAGNAITPMGTVKNMGTETISFNVNLTIEESGGSVVYDENLSVTDLSALESIDLTWPEWTSTAGQFTCTLTTELTGDENPANDVQVAELEAVAGVILLKPLYEEFTSSTCVPCAGANPILDAVLFANPGTHSLIKYQMDWPGSGDPYYTEEGGVRKDYYGVSGVPDLYINSDQLYPGDMTQTIYDSYQGLVTGMEIEVAEAAIDEDYMITVTANIDVVSNYDAGLTAHIVVVEKTTVGNATSNGETEFYHVMLKMLPDAEGTTLPALSPGTTQTITETYDMGLTHMEEPNDLAVIVFVQDDSDKSIIQSEEADVAGEFDAYDVTFNVEDSDGNPVEGAEIFLEGNGTQTTNAAGQTVYEGVFPGDYNYDVSKPGLEPASGSLEVVDQNVTENVVLNIPEYYYYEDFGAGLPDDWTTIFGGWNSVYWYDGKVIIFSQGDPGDIMLIAPSIDLEPVETLYIEVGNNYGTPSPNLLVGTVSDPSNPGSFTLLETLTPPAEGYEDMAVDMTGYSGTDTYVAFKYQGPGFGYFYIETVKMTEAAASELCVPEYVTGCALGDGFSDFAVEEIENYGTGCADLNGTGWSQYLELGPATLYQGQIHDFIMASGFTGNFATIWIDFNDDFTFTTEEIVLDNYWIQLQNQLYTVPVQIPADALTGTHYMRARTRFANFCDDPCASYFYGEAEDYMVTIEAAPSTVIFEDDFEAYNAGEQLACQNPEEWTTWSNLPCSLEDAYISDDFAYSGVNSVHIVTNNDQVKNLDTYFTSGVYEISLMIYIPIGADGYYNVMSDFNAAYEWGFEVYFNTGGDGSVNAGGTGTATFTFPFDSWIFSKLIVDLDNDKAYYFLDGEMIHHWQWTLGASGGGSQLQLAAVDLFGANATTSFYFDDFKIDEGIAPPPLPAPTDLSGPNYVITGADIVLTWEVPTTDVLLQWDNGINNDIIGLTNGGTFAVASHWEPDNLAPYDGMMLEKITFFAGDYPGPAFIIKVWTGENATEVLTQPLAGFVQNDWNEIVLDTPIQIDASQDLWFGYETTHVQGEYPAGCDYGPAIQGYGDMIFLDGEWSSLFTATGGAIDANWNLLGLATMSDGSQVAITSIKGTHTNIFNLTGSGLSALGYGSGKKYIQNSGKELLGYNVYRNGDQLAYTTNTIYTDNYPDPIILEYYVTAVYDSGESDPSNSWFVENFYITGLNENQALDLRVYPNPSMGIVTIKFVYQINQVMLYDQIGQKILVREIGSDQTKLDLSGFHPGIYLICIDTEKGTITKRLILN